MDVRVADSESCSEGVPGSPRSRLARADLDLELELELD